MSNRKQQCGCELAIQCADCLGECPTDRTELLTRDITSIIGFVNRQDNNMSGNDEADPNGYAKFSNTVACRNIRENLITYFQENFNEEILPKNFNEEEE